MVVINKKSLLIRTLSAFVMLTIFIVMLFSDNLIFLFFSQFLLFLTSWEILRMLEFKSSIKKRVDRSNFLLTRCRVRKYDVILIILVNLFIGSPSGMMLNLRQYKQCRIIFKVQFTSLNVSKLR